ncbi:U6 snRNA (guanine-N(2))-methyltransferase THUMPD2 [Rhinophrynus dorsalis]
MEVRFFCTAGRGMERFVTEEVITKTSATEVETMSGKVFFTAEPDLCRLKKLKSGERLFLLLKKGSPLSLPKNKGDALSILKNFVIGEPQMWLNALDTWQKLQEQPQDKNIPEGHGKILKRKLDRDSSSDTSKTRKQDHNVEKSACQFHNQKLEDSMIQRKDWNVIYCDEKNTTKKQPLSNENPTVTFRVSCRCSGANAKMFTSQEIGRVIGVSLITLFGWKTDLRRPVLEVFVHLNDLYSVVGFPVTRNPLASREYIQSTGMRSTTAWAMGSLAEISTGAFVLDPMCGVGTILLETAKEWPFASFLGIDISDSQLKSAVANVTAAGLTGSIGFLKASVLDLPVLSESIDVVISDIPFGKKFKSSVDMKELLPTILREMERVLRVGGVIILLLSQSLHYHLKTNFHFKAVESRNIHSAVEDSRDQDKNGRTTNIEDISSKKTVFDSLVAIESHSVSLGVTEAVIFKCKKTSKSMGRSIVCRGLNSLMVLNGLTIHLPDFGVSELTDSVSKGAPKEDLLAILANMSEAQNYVSDALFDSVRLEAKASAFSSMSLFGPKLNNIISEATGGKSTLLPQVPKLPDLARKQSLFRPCQSEIQRPNPSGSQASTQCSTPNPGQQWSSMLSSTKPTSTNLLRHDSQNPSPSLPMDDRLLQFSRIWAGYVADQHQLLWLIHLGIQGRWSAEETLQPINILELSVIFDSLMYWSSPLRGCRVIQCLSRGLRQQARRHKKPFRLVFQPRVPLGQEKLHLFNEEVHSFLDNSVFVPVPPEERFRFLFKLVCDV